MCNYVCIYICMCVSYIYIYVCVVYIYVCVCCIYIYAKIIQKNGCISCSSPFAPAEDNSDAGGISSEFAAAVPWLDMGSMAAPRQADSPFIRFSFDTHYQKKHVRNFGNFFIRFYTRMVLEIILIFFSPAQLLGEIKFILGYNMRT